ncbi:AGR226Wp [Eremothecium gossypii ATCC 10895]|uniref:AGR226Wp n=1 Tax=Eremothecium gossypii (strain ATCC 10895 / CBS 109.51 / FGSC 9923 / NRRL Y-1056) TaxID=284811 RepID=Q74ZW8_EREGS|nr:AGR226Wp [Eremothecium gossypii ATCC 10895]AAS54716.2 AGR226Wp [Eremothecium gossypii ATCC 10895]AEY99047.1 FAGR226Wp [Eremothecium gossypii FDAG1]
MDVLARLVESVAGKDKTAKIIKYTLDLLRLYLSQYRTRLVQSDPTALARYARLAGAWSWGLLVRHPVTLLKLWLVSVAKQFEAKSQTVCTNISIFRQMMRFGSTPFLARALYQKAAATYRQAQKLPAGDTAGVLQVVRGQWLNEPTLTDVLYLYYGIMDELSLTYSFGLWAHKGLYAFVARHEVLSWQYDILLSLKKGWCRLREINAKILDLEIQCKVRQRAWDISQKLHSARGTSPVKRQLLRDLQLGPTSDMSLTADLDALRQERSVLYVDFVRLTFDLLANSTDVFALRTPPGTYAWLSLGSGIAGFYKLWTQAKKELQQ